MYVEFDTVSFTAMSKIGSEPVLCDSLSRPPMSESPACGREPPAPEEKEDTQREAENDGGGGGGGGEATRAAVAEEDGTQDEVSSNQAAEEGRGGEQGDDIRHGHNDDDDDEGYHTPTSPRHRIPDDLPCPPAPRKALQEPRWRKRKAAAREFFRVVWRRSQLPPLGFELVLCPVPLASRTTESTASLADMLVKNKKNL